ncbi:MAG: SAM-dependent chlorinase/fluorinase [Sphingobacteriaceae bacterium]|nr:SAM-dependent chlorinase/fluorinase [Sphingobacteriaceae bacterium]
MGIVTLTTDLGYRDPYLAIVKAGLLAGNSNLQIIDLSCDIRDNNISDAAFILKNSIQYFPDNTIHLVAVKFIVESAQPNKTNHIDNTRYLLTKYKNQYIVSPDNGLFTLVDPLFNSPVYQIYFEDNSKHHFFLKDVFMDVAKVLLSTKEEDTEAALKDIGTITDDYYKAIQFESFVDKNVLRGKGIYIDDFGNIITNITKEQFANIIGKRSFTITLPGARISKIQRTYDEVKLGQPLVLFNSFGHLEVAVNGGSAQKMLCPRDIGTKFDFNLLIEFND